MIRYIFTLLLLFTTLSSVSASALPFAETSAIERKVSFDAPYIGAMDVTMGKGKTFAGRKATYILRDGVLLCDFPKVGKMPGKILIELPVEVAEDGRITAQPGAIAGAMKLPLGIKVKLKLISLDQARIVGRQLSFVLQVYGQFMGASFPTTVSFSGRASAPVK